MQRIRAKTVAGESWQPRTKKDCDQATDESAIRDILMRYERALNASDTAAVMSLYSDDGVFMSQHFPSSVGAQAVMRAYDVCSK